MKKMFFTAIGIVAFAGSGFASNEIVYNKHISEIEKNIELSITDAVKKPCSYSIIGTDAHGRTFSATWETRENVTREDCEEAKNNKVKHLESMGASIDSVSINWG